MRDRWVETTLAHVAEVNPKVGGVDSQSPFITMADVDEWGRWARTSGPRANRGGAKAIGGDVLVARITPCLENGKIAQVPHEWGPVGGSTEFLVVRARSQVLPDYLYYWAQEPQTHLRSTRRMIGTSGRKRVSAGDYEQLPFLLPPIEEQRRIVDLMKATDAAVESLREELKTLTATHLAWLASLGSRAQQEGWSSQSLAEVIRGSGTIQTGPFGSQLHRADYVEDGDVPVVMPANMADWTVNLEGIARITSARAEPLARHRLREGDIAWSRRGDVTRFAVIGEDSAGALCGTGCFLIRSEDRKQAAWLHTWLKTPGVAAYLLDAAVGGTMDNLNAGILGGITVAVPPAAAGEDISRLGRSIEANQSRLKQEIVRVQQLRSALLSAVTSGQHEVPASYDEFIRDEGAA